MSTPEPQAAPPAWRERLHERRISDETIDDFGISSDGKGWTYPVPGADGLRRWKNHDSSGTPKYKWTPPSPRMPSTITPTASGLQSRGRRPSVDRRRRTRRLGSPLRRNNPCAMLVRRDPGSPYTGPGPGGRWSPRGPHRAGPRPRRTDLRHEDPGPTGWNRYPPGHPPVAG